jgi:hypothetical protein
MDERAPEAADPTSAPVASADRRSGWDFALMLATTALLGGLGVQSLAGTLYSWWAARTASGWSDSAAYADYIAVMNALAAPMVLALVVVMGLCVPKRLFSRAALVVASAALVASGLGVWAITGSRTDGLAIYLLGAGSLQVAVVVMTLAGAPSLRYVADARLAKVGSGLLHLGIIVFGYVIVAMQSSGWMLPVFWMALALTIGGTALSFYAGSISASAGRAGAGPGSADATRT